MYGGLPVLQVSSTAAALTLLFNADPSIKICTSSSACSISLMESSLLLAMLIIKGSIPQSVGSLDTTGSFSIFLGSHL